MALAFIKWLAANASNVSTGHVGGGNAAHVVKKVTVHGLRNTVPALQHQCVAQQRHGLLMHGQWQLRWRQGHVPVV